FAFDLPTVGGSPTEVQFHDLTQVHTTRNTQWVQNHINRCAISHERHVFDGKDLGDDALVPVAASHLVTVLNFTLLRDVDTDKLVDTGWQIVVFEIGRASCREGGQ